MFDFNARPPRGMAAAIGILLLHAPSLAQTGRNAQIQNKPDLGALMSSDYDFPPQHPGVSLSAGIPAILRMTPCPRGVQPNEVAISAIRLPREAGRITAATKTTPIRITEPSHGRANGSSVYITGVNGNLAANGYWQITVVDANHYSLNGSMGSGAYTTGGSAYTPPVVNTASAMPIHASAFVTISHTSAAGLNGVFPVSYISPTSFSIVGAGVAGSASGGYVSFDNLHSVYLSGGTGTPEADPIEGGSCTSGAASGTIRITPQYSHSGAFTVGPATSGITEAIKSCPNDCTILLPAGSLPLYAPLYIGDGDDYANVNTGRSVNTTSGNRVRIWGAGAAGNAGPNARVGGTWLQYMGPDTQSTAMAPAVELRGSWNSELAHLTIANCASPSGSCSNTALLLRNVWWSRIYDLNIISLNGVQGAGLDMEYIEGNVLENISVNVSGSSPRVYPLLFGNSGFFGQYGIGGGSRNTFRRVDLYAPENGCAAILGSIDNNIFDEFFTMGGSGGILFKQITPGTTPYAASFPQENTFLHSPIVATTGTVRVPISGTAGTGACNWFLPYPTSDGETVPMLPGVCSITTNGLNFGIQGDVTGHDVASASTIAPSGKQFRLTGTAAVNRISLPWSGFDGCLTIIPTDAVAFGTSGNIAADYAATPNVPIMACYAASVRKWYLK